jgi:myo-inositol-1(or 4)-monophosphatase
MDGRLRERAAVSDRAVRTETKAAIRAARLAQRIADSRAGADDVRSKGGIDIVTRADIACEDAIRAELGGAFPAYAVVGEERGGEPTADLPYWLVDPICGTRCYASNVPLYCANIALVERGEVTVAVVAIGGGGDILYAERGNGAHRVESSDDGDVTPLQASAASHVLWIGGRRDRMAEFARRVWLADRWFLWTFSSSVGYAYLARGNIAGLVHFGFGEPEPPVHTAAGCLLAQEAGALVTDIDDGKPWRLESRSFLIAADPGLHRELLELTAERS